MPRASIILATLTLAACTTTQQAHDALQTRWLGRSADAFFVQYGPPASSFPLADGRLVYEWTGGRRNYALGGSAFTTAHAVGSTAYATTSYSGGGTLAVGCSVRIVADGERTIQAIAPTVDTVGRFTTSRCAEVFGGG